MQVISIQVTSRVSGPMIVSETWKVETSRQWQHFKLPNWSNPSSLVIGPPTRRYPAGHSDSVHLISGTFGTYRNFGIPQTHSTSSFNWTTVWNRKISSVGLPLLLHSHTKILLPHTEKEMTISAASGQSLFLLFHLIIEGGMESRFPEGGCRPLWCDLIDGGEISRCRIEMERQRIRRVRPSRLVIDFPEMLNEFMLCNRRVSWL